MPLSVGHKRNFNTLRRAFRTGDAALMECQLAATGETAAVICAVNRLADGSSSSSPSPRCSPAIPMRRSIRPTPTAGSTRRRKSMADRMAGEIWIGGTISPALAEELCAVVRDTGASLEWGGGVFAPDSVAELLEANDDGHLHLYDDDRAWGEFADLEEFLREHKIPYDRQTASRYEYDAA